MTEHLDFELDAYVDRELDADGTARVRQHLETCAACRQRVADRQQLGRLVRAAAYREAPQRLRARVSAHASRRTTAKQVMSWAAAAVLAVSVGTGIAVMRPWAGGAGSTAEEVVNGHVRSLMAEHLFDVRSTDQHTVKPWFLGRLDFAPPVADLASVGFPLVGGRLDYLGGRPVAALVYQRQKHTINVFVSPDAARADTGVDGRSIRGFHVRHWIKNGMSFWAVSDLNDAELTEFVRALQQA